MAACLADVPLAERPPQANAPVVLFVDRSASMRGFLDPAFPTRVRTDYRSVIDKLVVGLRPEEGYSFGAAVQPIQATLATLGDREFYSDGDTRVEDALAIVARDSVAARSFIIIGDARRGTPTAADGQFAQMRLLAERRVDAGGSFIVAASLAPFSTVPSDPSGCRSDQADDPRQTCPLYAFAFVARGADAQIATALAHVFEHVYAWPMRTIAGTSMALEPAAPRTDVRFTREWPRASDGAPVARVQGPAPVTRWLTVHVRLRDTTDAAARGVQAQLDGQQMQLRVTARSFAPAAKATPWQPAGGAAALVRPTPGVPLAIDVVTRGPQAPATIYRVDVVPSGQPSWLDEFDAANAGDRLRTYGLTRLFEPFRQRSATMAMADSAAAARFYVIAN